MRSPPTLATNPSPLPRLAAAVYYPVGYVYPGFFMAHGAADPRAAADGGDGAALGGGPLTGAGQQHNGGLPNTIDALKARVMDAGPGEVKSLIAASRLPLR